MDVAFAHRIIKNTNTYTELFCFVIDHLMPAADPEYMHEIENKTMIEIIMEQKRQRELARIENGETIDSESFPPCLTRK